MTGTVLAIDDDHACLDGIDLTLTSHGYKVLKFSNATEALEYLKVSGSVDLIITDMELPDMWAQKFLVLLRRIPTIGYIPVIVQSSAYFDLINECIQLGASGYIQKPYYSKNILDIVESFLSQKSPNTPRPLLRMCLI
jgi:CheY-like chemotaxis protein